MVNSRDSIMVRLLDYCIKSLAARGMGYLFLDAVRGGDSGLQALGKLPTYDARQEMNELTSITGFQRWARYREIWKKI